MRRLIPLALALLLLGAGCLHGRDAEDDTASPPPPPAAEDQPGTAEPAEDPAEAVRELVRQVVGGEGGAAWERLHPAQRERVGQEAFERCLEGLRAFELESVRVDDVVEEEVDVEGETLPGRTVVTQVTLMPRVGEQTVVSDSRRLAAVDGQWHWLLAEDELAAYEGGGCPQLPLGGNR